MSTVTKKKVFAAAALIFVTGVSAVALPHSPAQAMSLHGPGTPAYAVSRILEAFDVVAEMPQVEPVRVPMATKGDLPVPLGCIGMQTDEQAECMDVAYEVPSEPSIVVETRVGNTSILTRIDDVRVSGLAGEEPKVGRIDAAFQVVSRMPPVLRVPPPATLRP
jgi:hypothetical protein